MKTTCKRMLSMLLVLILVLSLIPSVSAATDEEAASTAESSASDQAVDDDLGTKQEDALEENPIQVMAADDYAVMAAAST